jgi:type VII secretion integral membrane protein EccD
VSGYTRLTLVGSSRRVDVVVPDDEPVGRLMPEVLQLTGEAPASPAVERRLALLDGRLLDQDRSLGEAEVLDGAVVRVVGMADAPPPPVVLDVAEEAAADLDDLARWRWGPHPRRWLATALTVAAALAALEVALPHPDRGQAVRTGVLAAALVVGGALLGRLWSSVLGTTLVLTGGALALDALPALDLPLPVLLGAVGGVLAAVVLALGLATPLGRGAVVGGAVGLLLVGCWALVTQLLPGARAAGCLAVGTALLLGLLPRTAALLAGLTALDDRRTRDERVRRRDVQAALRATHRSLALATVAVAASALAAVVALTSSGNRWAVVLAVLLVLVLAVRVRAFPLVVEVVALAVALAGSGLVLLLAWLAADPGAVDVVVAVLVAAALAGLVLPLVRFTPQLRARGRVLGDRLEVVAVVAMVPVLVGVFDVYPRLLASF